MSRSRMRLPFWVAEVVVIITWFGLINVDMDALFYASCLAVIALLPLSFSLKRTDPNLYQLGLATFVFAAFYAMLGYRFFL